MTVRRRRAQPVRWACIFAGSLAVGLVGCDGGDGSAPGPARGHAGRASAPAPQPVAASAPPKIIQSAAQPPNATAVVDPAAPGPGENGTPPTGPVYVGPITQGINTDQSLPAHPVRGPTASLPEGTRQIEH